MDLLIVVDIYYVSCNALQVKAKDGLQSSWVFQGSKSVSQEETTLVSVDLCRHMLAKFVQLQQSFNVFIVLNGDLFWHCPQGGQHLSY